jgi:hypothetical protein
VSIPPGSFAEYYTDTALLDHSGIPHWQIIQGLLEAA